MAITNVSSSTFLSDTINLIRDKIKNNVTDPLASSRSSIEKFVLTSYPQRAVTYPIITVTDRNITQPSRLGMASESTLMRIDVEIRVWARNVKERDELTQQIYDYLRTNQLDKTTGLADSNLHDFTLMSAVNVDESGENAVKSKVMEVRFLLLIN